MKKRLDADEELGDGKGCECCETKPYTYIHQPVTRNIHHFYISAYIEDAHLYVDMINKIQTAGADDIIYIHLNTVGGYMTAGIQIINAMHSSSATVITSLEGEVSSLGTMLFLAADDFIVHENSSLMFHNYSGGVWGKGHEQVAALESATKWIEDFMLRLYVPFMTVSEVQRLIKGEDIYMHPPEITERLQHMVDVRAKEAEEAEEEPVKPATKTATRRKKTTAKKGTAKKRTTTRKC